MRQRTVDNLIVILYELETIVSDETCEDYKPAMRLLATACELRTLSERGEITEAIRALRVVAESNALATGLQHALASKPK